MPVNILVADDSVTIRRIMELTFAGEDALVTTVESGQACIEKARETAPDVVFTDVSMPAMDGYELASAIRALPGLDHTAIIMLASQKNPYDEGRGKASGVDDHVLKPFDTQHVIDRVNQVLSRPRAKSTAAANAAAAPQPSSQPAAAPTNGAAAAAPPPPPPATASRPSRASSPVVPLRQENASATGPASSPPAAASAATANGSPLHQRLQEMGLDAAQVNGVLALSREVIEQVVWEVVPELAETLIREEIRRLTAE